MYRKNMMLVAGLLLGLSGQTAKAALYDRGSGLIYDDVLNITWLKDANYAKTSGFDGDGQMDWNTANAWAGNLVYHDSVRNIDYSDWRLPTVPARCNSGPSCVGNQIDPSDSELAYMYSVNLGNTSQLDNDGNPNPGWSNPPNASFQDAANGNAANSFTNLESYGYWTEREWTGNPDTAWFFNPAFGNQLTEYKIDEFHGWAVRAGDVTSVPLPGAIWLFGSALIVGFKNLTTRKQSMPKKANSKIIGKSVMGVFRMFLVSLCVAMASQANASTIVNIQGFGDGVNSGSGANIFSYPVAPGAIVTLQNPVLVNLAKGDYILANAWGQSGALYNTWNFQKDAAGSWASHYVVAESASGSNFSILLDVTSNLEPTCKNHFCAWDTEAQATQAFLDTPPVFLHLTKDTQVAFASADYYLPDNLGGISISITAVPLPAGVWLFASGLLTVLGFGGRHKPKSVA